MARLRELRARFLSEVFPALIATGFSRWILFFAARAAKVPFAADSFVRWDSGHYLSIAEKGYEFVSCRAIGFASPDDWCGNTGWFPGYPYLIRILSWVGFRPAFAGTVISFLCFILALVIVWKLIDGKLNEPGSWVTLFCAAVFPGTVYSHAVFPISLTQLFILLSIDLVLRKRYGRGVAATFGAAFSYTSGLLAGAGIFLYSLVLAFRRKVSATDVRGLAVVCAGSVAGFVAVMLLMWASTGVPDALFKAQAKYKHSGGTLFQSVHDATLAVLGKGGTAWPSPMNLETVTINVFLLVLVAELAIRLARRGWKGVEELDLLVVCVALPLFLVEYALAAISIYRSDALLLPLVLVTRRWPLVLRLGLLCWFVYLVYGMEQLFFTKYLV